MLSRRARTMRPGARGEQDLLAVEQVLQVRVEGHLAQQAAPQRPHEI